MRKSVLIFVLALIPVSFAHGQIPTTERDALIALYNATNGPGWGALVKDTWRNAGDTDFEPSGTECAREGVTGWAGIFCVEDPPSQWHVQRIDLIYVGLSGEIPTELKDLEHLEVLNLANNLLTGTIPVELGNLANLKTLQLGFNQLTGSIPAALGNLTSLETLNLCRNQLDNEIPAVLGSLPNLKYLVLYINQLTGLIPEGLGNAPSLIGLSLNGNALTGNIPPMLGNLLDLETLILAENQLFGKIPEALGNLPSLTYLDLSENQLSDKIPPELGQLENLTWLDLSHNQLTSVIPEDLEDLTDLTHLILTDNQLIGKIPAGLWNLPSLVYFHAQFNQLSGNIPAPDPGDLPVIENLRLSHNRLTGEIPLGFRHLTTLEFLSLLSNQLSGSIPTELQNLTALRSTGLDFRWNALHTNDSSLIAFLESKHSSSYGGWDGTQTIAPINIKVGAKGNHTVWLSWDEVTYTADPGGYSVFSAPHGTDIWTAGGWTEGKDVTVTTFPVTGLDPGTAYDFAVITYTDPHDNDLDLEYTDNFNLVNSNFSAEDVQATTPPGSCSQPIIEISGWGPWFTLSLTEGYDDYVWSTTGTDPSIDVNPSYDQWYWVTVTDIAASCVETAAIWFDPFPIFHDEFESGDTTEWSSKVP